MGLYKEHDDFQKIVDYYRYINSVDIRSAYGKRDLVNREREMQQRRQVYLNARKDRRALEILKEKRKEEHRVGEDREEAQMLNEISIQRFHVKRHK